MFGSPFTTLGQSSSSSPIGSYSNGTPSGLPFGSFSNGTPFGSPFGTPSNGTPFGSPLGGLISGENLKPAFGAISSPSSSMTTFGASSCPAFGSSTPAFGSPFFNQNSGSAFQQTQSASHDNAFSRSSVFSPQSRSNFSTATVSPSGTTTVCGFGGMSNTPVGIFSTPAFGGTSAGFGVSTAPSFVSGGAPPLFNTCSNGSLENPREDGASRTNLFGSLSTSTSREPNNSTFGMKSTSLSGNTGFHLNSAPIVGQSASAFGNSNLIGSTPPFGTQKFPAGFGHSVTDGVPRGSRVTHYAATEEIDDSGKKIESLCAMKSYLHKSHEELRLEDYQSGDKGGSRLASQSLDGNGLVTSRANPSSSSVAPLETSLFPSPVYSNPFAPQIPSFGPPGTSRSTTTGLNPSLNPFTPLSSPNISASQTSSVKFIGTGGPSVKFIGTGGPSVNFIGTGGSPFGTQNGGSRLTSYTATLEDVGSNGTVCGSKIESISAMPAYKNKSHEELRLENFQLGDKGGFKYMNQSTGGIGVFSSTSFPSVGDHSSSSAFYPSSNTLAPQTVFGPPGTGISATNSQIPSLNYFCSNQLAPQTPPFSSLSSNASTAALNPTSSNMLSSISPFLTSSLSSTSTTGTVPESASRPQISSSPSDLSCSPFFSSFSFVKSTPAPEISSAFNNQPAQQFQFFAPIEGHTSALDGSSTTPFYVQQNTSSSSPVGLNLWGNLSSNTAGLGISDVMKGVDGQSIEGQQPSIPTTEAMQQPPVTNPFGTPNVVLISVDRPGSSVSIQYGISSRPVSDNPAPVRRSSLLRVRHTSLSRNWLPVQKYNAKSDSPKVPFFANEEKTKDTWKADVSFIPRENPRSWILSPSKEWVLRDDSEKLSSTIINLHENGNISLKQSATAPSSSRNEYAEGISGETRKEHDNNSCEEEDFNVEVHGNQYNKAADLYRHDAGVESVIPNLRRTDYYSEPSIQELAAKEKAEPGFCCHVKDFVIGRRGYGSIKFLGETDISKLDLDAHVQFNYREVIVYMDESKRPPVGQGLNKPAEVTLLNVKCISKKTGKQYIDGSKVDQYRGMLIKKATEQGAEFISFDPVLGEWKFKVQHF